MDIYTALNTCLFICIISTHCHAFKEEPKCFSKFDFEEKVLEKLVRIEHKMEVYEENMKTMVDDYNLQKEAIQSMLETERETLQPTIDEFKVEHQEIKQTVTALTTSNAAMVEDAVLREMRINHLFNTTLDKAVSDITARLETPTVAFMARDLHNWNPASDERLVFPVVLANQGDAYNPTTGVFTAPVPGIYVFSVQIAVITNTWIDIQLTHNDEIIGAFVSGDPNYNNSNVGFAVTELEVGDSVAVKKYAGTTNSVSHNKIKRWTSFSGVLVKATTQ